MKKTFIIGLMVFCSIQGCIFQRKNNADIEKNEYDSLVNVVTDLKARIKNLEPQTERKGTVVRDGYSDYFGIWKIQSTFDDYGEPLGHYYAVAEINGEMFNSNSYVPSSLKVKLCMDNSSVWLEMYEYSGIIPLSGKGALCLRVKDRYNVESQISAFNSKHGEINVLCEDTDRLRKIMLSGGKIMFIVFCPGEHNGKQYKFNIENADFLDRALAKIDTVK